MASRKDNKGRVLRAGESQRKDGSYQYRYLDNLHRRKYVYAPSLEELRKKEQEILVSSCLGVSYADASITVLELIERYFPTISGNSYNTKITYDDALKRLKTQPLSRMRIKDVKTSDAKMMLISLNNSGYGYSTLRQLKGILRPAFAMAVEDDVLNKNPFDFSLSKIIHDDTVYKKALTRQQQQNLLGFVKTNQKYSPRYEEVAILLGTGMRVSEFVGLTMRDVNMESREISVNHQLIYHHKRGLYITKPKSKSGIRTIPMSDEVFECFKSLIKRRKTLKVEPSVDGVSGFILLTRYGNPSFGALIREMLIGVVEEYNKVCSEKSALFEPMPRISPHVLRHTFCTNFINAGASIKQAQYIMGHASANITMNVYAHSMYGDSKEEIVDTLNRAWFRSA